MRGTIRCAASLLTLAAALAAATASSAAATADPVAALSGLLSADRRIEVTAETVSRETAHRVLVAEGAVDIVTGQIRLRADRVELNEETMDLTAAGHVILNAGEDRLQGESLRFNLRDETGILEEGEGFAQAFYFRGRRIERLSADQYRVLNGSFTSCQGELPDWSFASPEALIQMDDYIYSWHPTLRIKDVPVFYVPYAVVPIKRGRVTGLLVPRFRYHKTDGFIYNQSFFWAPVDNADATVTLDLYSHRGPRYALEVNYLLEEDTTGRAASSFIRDRLLGKDRWDLAVQHRHALPWEVRGTVDIDYLSDQDYRRDYGTSLEQTGRETMSSLVSLTRSLGVATLDVSGEWRESLTGGVESRLSRWPEARLTSPESPVLDGPLYWSLELQGVHLEEDGPGGERTTTRYHAAPGLSLPVAIGTWANLIPSLELLATHYTRDKEGERHSRVTSHPRVEFTGPRLYRIYGEENTLPRFRHLVTPRLAYNYVPRVDQQSIPVFDSLDRIAADNSLTLGLTNQVFGKFQGREGKAVLREVGRLDLSTAYYLDPELKADGRRWRAIRAVLSVNPLDALALDADATWDPEEKRMDAVNYGLDWRDEKRGSLSLERRYHRQGNVDYLEGGITLKPGSWELAYRGRYDLEEASFAESEIGATYTAGCWDATLSYIRREEDYEYRFLLNFKEIGTILKF